MSSDSGRSSYESISNSYGNRSRSVSRSISGDEAEGIVYAAPPPPRSVPLPPSRGPGRPPPIGGYRRNFARRHDIVVGKPSLFLEYEDDVYRFPWELCQTRQAVIDLAISTLSLEEEAQKQIREGDFEFQDPKGAVILPQYWEQLVEPGWTVALSLSNSKLSREKAKNTTEDTAQNTSVQAAGPDVSMYDNRTQYTVEYYEKDRYDRRSLHLKHSYFLTQFAVLQHQATSNKINGVTLPVLQENQAVVLSDPDGFGKRIYPEDEPSSSVDIFEIMAGEVVGRITLQVNSHLILNALRTVVSYLFEPPSGKEDSLRSGLFKYPFRDIVHHKNHLLDYKHSRCGGIEQHTEEYVAEYAEHLDILIDYLYKQPSLQLKESEDAASKEVPTTTFGAFWLLIKPGSDVYVREDGELNPYVVESIRGGIDGAKVNSYIITVWNLAFDGKSINRQSKVVAVLVFDGSQDITSLSIFPSRFLKNENEFRQTLVQRGKKYLGLSKGPKFMEYTGVGGLESQKLYKRERIVIEHASQPWSHRQNHLRGLPYISKDSKIGTRGRIPFCECSQCKPLHTQTPIRLSVKYMDYDDIYPEYTEELTDHQYFLCASSMYGFVLKDRAYDYFDLSGISEPRLALNAIDQLVMRPESNKDTIKAIVKTYTSDTEDLIGVDFIPGKGEGQIILLHGPPGTGKTLTAESVAEFTKRPLLGITAADLGHEPDILERRLLKFFKRANDWDAIVLLDEADVYLEQRSVHDLKRNSIVSIFLRALDYFQGILFLTTNRVGHFDEAFMSRIHLQLGYDPLDADARDQIWNNFFEKLKKDYADEGLQIAYEYDAKEYVKKSADVKILEWNGREIRNAFQTAVALAIFDARTADEKSGAPKGTTVPEVKERHLRQVVSMSAAFKKYMIKTHQEMTDSQRAYKLGSRHDGEVTREMARR